MYTKYKSLYKIIIILSISGLILPNLCLGETSGTAGPPQSFSDVKAGFKVFEFIPQTLKKIWQEGTTWLKNIWNSYIYPFLHKIWQKIDSIFGKEIKQREPVIKEEFKKETEEMKKEVPLVTKSLWEKFKELIK